LGQGLPFNSPARWQLINQRFSTPLPLYNCPSRRSGGPFENTGWGIPFGYRETGCTGNCVGTGLITTLMARTDYASCAGDQWTPEIDGGPSSYAQADSGAFNFFPGVHARTDFTRPDGRYGPSGVVYRRSETRMADVAQKGTSNQYMIGEKFLRSDKYRPGPGNQSDGGDNENMYAGGDNDTGRVTFYLPAQDQVPPFQFPDAKLVRGGVTVGNNETFRFGSMHPSGFNMMMCDGSVHIISYSINADVFRQGGNRTSSAVGPFFN
jgi:prepilin-type processing-associated H-X9-DG protein